MALWNVWKKIRGKPRVSRIWDWVQVVFLTLILMDLLSYFVLREFPLSVPVLGTMAGALALMAGYALLTFVMDTSEDSAFELLIMVLTMVAALVFRTTASLVRTPVAGVLMAGFGLSWMINLHQLGVWKKLWEVKKLVVSVLRTKAGELSATAAAGLEDRMKDA